MHPELPGILDLYTFALIGHRHPGTVLTMDDTTVTLRKKADRRRVPRNSGCDKYLVQSSSMRGTASVLASGDRLPDPSIRLARSVPNSTARDRSTA
jgi:hypothetical protein